MRKKAQGQDQRTQGRSKTNASFEDHSLWESVGSQLCEIHPNVLANAQVTETKGGEQVALGERLRLGFFFVRLLFYLFIFVSFLLFSFVRTCDSRVAPASVTLGAEDGDLLASPGGGGHCCATPRFGQTHSVCLVWQTWGGVYRRGRARKFLAFRFRQTSFEIHPKTFNYLTTR